jgi:membrane protease YdiL (CAAX protease family)
MGFTLKKRRRFVNQINHNSTISLTKDALRTHNPQAMKKSVLREIFFVTGITFVLLAVFDQIIRLGGIFASIAALCTPVLFLYTPTIILKLRKIHPDSFGLKLGDVRKNLAMATITAALFLPLYAVGFWVFRALFLGRTIELHWGTPVVTLILWNLIAVAIPEEIFFRGYIQSRLYEVFPARFRFLKMEISAANLGASIIFALAHLIAVPNPFRLLVFFPSLIFGRLREKSDSVFPPAIFHWLCNVTVILLTGSA